MKNTEIIKNLELILECEATNYLESSERLFLMNILQKLETKNYELSEISPSVGLLQFIRSTPGVLAPLVGQKSDSHVTDNLQVMKIDALSKDDFEKTVKNLTS